MFISKNRIIWSVVLSVLFVIYAFNFVPRNINIVATKTLGRQVADYTLNFVIFFIVIYLVFSLIAYLIKFFSAKK